MKEGEKKSHTPDQPVKQHDQDNDKQCCVDMLIIFCQPFRQENVKIIFCRIRITPGQNSYRAQFFKGQQNKAFQQDDTDTDPHPFINPVYNDRIKKVNDHTVEK